ncbi:MAG: DUF4388 domain-containing protein [Acidobacteriota bacterium]
MRTTFGDEGDLRATDVLAGLVALWREGASGLLHFSRSGATAGFQLAAGEVTSVSSSESRFETASILLRAGKLDAATLERLSASEAGDRAFAALQAGVLTKREWRWGEKIRAVEVLSDLLTWIEGDYVFDRATVPTPGEFRLTVPRLVLELFLRSRDRSLVLHHLGGVDVPLARAPHFDSEFSAFGLTADAEAVVRLIDGRATAAEISSGGSAEPFAVEKLLSALVTLGLIHPEFAAAEPPAEAERPRPVEITEDEADLQARPEHFGNDRAFDVTPESPRDDDEVVLDVDALEGPDAASVEAREWDLVEQEMRRGSVDAAPSSEPERLPEDMVDIPSSSASVPVFDRPLDMATGIGADGRPKTRSSGPFVALFALLVAAVAAVILLRGRGSPARNENLASKSTPTPAESVSGAAIGEATPVALSPMATVTAAAPAPVVVSTLAPEPRRTMRTAASPTRAPMRTAVAAAPTSRPAAATPRAPAVTPRAPAVAPGQSVPSTSQGWLERAARDRQRAGGDHKAHFTIQLELACETSTLADAWRHDRPAGAMWVLTTPYQGKTCFRVLWGRYATREGARRALSGVPAFFSTGDNRPVVTSIR